MNPYSQDLRERILQTLDEGKTRAEVAQLFKVSTTTVKRYVKQRREKGHVRPKPIPGRPPKKQAPLQASLQAQLENAPDATLQEHCQMWKALSGVKVSISTMSRAIQGLRWTRKKDIGSKREKRRRTQSMEG